MMKDRRILAKIFFVPVWSYIFGKTGCTSSGRQWKTCCDFTSAGTKIAGLTLHLPDDCRTALHKHF